MQLSYAVEHCAHRHPSTLGPFHVEIYNRIRKTAGSQKISNLKPLLPKTLNIAASSASSKAAGKKKATSGKASGTMNRLDAFLEEIDISQDDWESAKSAMNSMIKNKNPGVKRHSPPNATYVESARTFWVRSRDILGTERISVDSDKLTALVYSFVISHFFHLYMIQPELKSEEWLWEAWKCRSNFEHLICDLFDCDNGDWIWADHIPLSEVDVERPEGAPYLESVYDEQVKEFGPQTIEHVEKLNASVKAIMASVSRFPLDMLDTESREEVAELTNEFVKVSTL